MSYYADKDAHVAFIADYLSGLSFDDAKRVCGRHGISLGMMGTMLRFGWDGPKFIKAQSLRAALDEAADSSLQELYDFARRSY
jgi:hypothetical protein